ncbi:LptA/OstA family protein [Paeniroseomonas aquatica]|uniref:LptA/OstA family protein n=1 Tax=Paeniroseomonas aquatica TaxID=373043 RepID=A0ABT8A7Z4_9PROT|nr:LptA/OstA family protein [Paeniroseomonas aquatica]MDN3565942.1 LptA/OstA family protein [Paeniroseomonas aquatica]
MRRVLRAAMLAGTALGWPLLAWGQGLDLSQGGPVDVTASDGIEWRQAEQVVIARGNARAVRGGVTVDSDRLMARYRPQARAGAAPAPPPAAGPATAPDEALGGGSEIWRLEAEGRVRITSATDVARGDRAVYDIDQAVLVLTGRDLSLTTAQQVITATDSLEYWSQRKMAVARGNAVVVDNAEGRRITADTLVSYFLDGPGTAPSAPRPAPPVAAAGAAGREPPGSGKLDRVEAFGNVEIRTPTEVVRGSRGVYSAATGMARLLGDVRITRGDNQVNGQEAIVNMRTGVARLVSAPGARVQGLILPNQNPDQPGEPAAGQPRGQGGATQPATPERRSR